MQPPHPRTLAAPLFFGLATLAFIATLSGHNHAHAEDAPCSPVRESVTFEHKHTLVDGEVNANNERFGGGGVLINTADHDFHLGLYTPDDDSLVVPFTIPN